MDEDKVLGAITGLGSDLGALRSDMGALRSDIRTEMADLRAAFVDRFDHADYRVDQIEDKQAEFRVAVMARFGRVEDKMTGLSEDLSVTMGTALNAMQRHENDRDELRRLTDMVGKMYMLVKRLQTDVEELQKKAP